MVDGSSESPGRSGSLGRQVSGQRRKRLIVARIIGELDRDRLGVTFRYCAVQFLNCPLGLVTLIEAYEADAFGEA